MVFSMLLWGSCLLAQLFSYKSPNGQLVITDRPIKKPGYKLVDKYIPKEVKAAERRATPLNSKYQLSWDQIDGLVDPIANAYGVDPELVKAVIEIESSRNYRALSNKGAMGLMQLIPDTAKRFGVADAWDPRENIKGGIKYLKFLLGYFEGDVNLTLAAYNAGEHAVDKYGGVPPYRETRRYIKKVRQFYQDEITTYDPTIGYRSVLCSRPGKGPVKPVAQLAK
ncbi:MAG: lytic transglycosylase domain-containing protein [Acidobacteria bacterium]|nr:lytic transglycosylase domain-containing protein [Acidobacteriota bacterium]